ncbi:putative bifunctional diguanylate cyclase/phosphodiesterase, partial [Aeromonas sp. HMWF014]|uniref:putative bifunctional diguanylate cyclase/phosphodiesterase n=1 Tax=Aeromonas sp. HMWF014 TaxID=2056850 RepID=UPI000D4D944E
VYQPIISTRTNQLHGAELLCRWPHPELGMISPDEFIPLAEELGLIGKLGQRMLEQGCAQLARWQAAAPDLVLSINLSPLQFRDPELCPQIFACIERHGLAPWQLELEITEGVLMENADEIESNLTNLIEAGFQLAIDDFGTGYCSLAYLPRLQVATLKLDRSFTQGLTTNQATTAIVRSVIGLGHELGIRITAEGVETPEQQAWLVQAGCDRLQGYLFSRPLPPDEFARSYQLPVPDSQPTGQPRG